MSDVIVLTKYWAFWGERSLREAMKLVVKGKVEVIKADESRHIKTGISRNGATFKMPAPLIVRLLEFGGVKIKSEEINFSKEAVFQRDNYRCQYYHYDDKGHRYVHKCAADEVTLDHVLPKSRGGADHDFTNSVTCCKWHNVVVKKGRTPKEAGLELVRKPIAPRLRKGDMVVIKFQFNPSSIAHRAFQEIMGIN
jgi:5-methylcytosine-specific restriction endonuclease McrA